MLKRPQRRVDGLGMSTPTPGQPDPHEPDRRRTPRRQTDHAGGVPTPSLNEQRGFESTDAAERLTALAHELRNMLDGSMRWLGLAANELPGAADEPERLEAALRQIGTVRTTLERMSGLVHAALRNPGVTAGAAVLGVGDNVTLGEAIDHAADLVRPACSDLGVSLGVHIDRDAGLVPAGPLYPVVLNGLRNAVESVQRCLAAETAHPEPAAHDDDDADHTHETTPAGRVSVAARMLDATGGTTLEIEIIDDGHGLPDGGSRAWPFRHGYSIKPEGGGVGLSVAEALVRERGGTIELASRPERVGNPRPGAVLRIHLPMDADQTNGNATGDAA